MYIQKMYYKIYVFLTYKVAQTKNTDDNFDVNYKSVFFLTDIDDLVGKIEI